LYDELIKNYNQANVDDISPMAQLHNDAVYTLSGIHMLETVAKPMLQMLETQRESSTKRIQILQTKLDQLNLGQNDEYFCDGDYKNNDQDNLPKNSAYLNDEDLSTSLADPVISSGTIQKKSSMVSSPV